MRLIGDSPEPALKRWREEVGRKVLNLDFGPIGDQPFHANLSCPLDEAGVRIVRWDHSPGMTMRDKAMVRDGEAQVTLIYSYRDPLEVHHVGRERRLQRGEGLLLINSEPGKIIGPKGGRFISILFEEHRLDPDLISRCIMNPVRRADQGLGLLRRYVDCLAPSSGCLLPEIAATAGRHVADLASLALGGAFDTEHSDHGSGVQDARLTVALHYIAANFRDPGLDEHKVAARQGLSVRQLQRMMERSGLSFTRHVNQLKLQSAHAALCDPAQSQRRILDIALASGFSDVSHFNRLFKRAYDASPTAVRSRHNRRAPG